MSLSLDMLRFASAAASFFPADAVRDLAAFVRGCQAADGGFRGRAGGSDLYYTAFAVECLCAVGQPLPRESLDRYLASVGDPARLDLAHLSCLARCRARLHGDGAPGGLDECLHAAIRAHRVPDGGWRLSATGSSPVHGSVYAAFLAALALEDLGLPRPCSADVLPATECLRAADGGYANEPGRPSGSTPATAAAVVLQHVLAGRADRAAVEWLLARFGPAGGGLAAPAAPMPDLLSTATALYALRTAEAALDSVREPALDFVESLWSDAGGFAGTIGDPTPDCEYTYYGLLALGCLT